MNFSQKTRSSRPHQEKPTQIIPSGKSQIPSYNIYQGDYRAEEQSFHQIARKITQEDIYCSHVK